MHFLINFKNNADLWSVFSVFSGPLYISTMSHSDFQKDVKIFDYERQFDLWLFANFW